MSTQNKFTRIRTFKDYVGELTVTYRRTKELTTNITCSKDAADYMRYHFDTCMDDHEEFKILHLNNANKVVHVDHISVGTEVGTLVSIRRIIRNALMTSSKAFLCFHNHPSSKLKPSLADKQVTKKIADAAALMDMKVLDHIILTREGYYSFADEGIMP
ncbi:MULTISPECIES: RadC family protein [Flavobacteriaceae]|uniref:JAB domain-containing protein n=1 Tax=Flavobacteriaceae TaxID=49546 RepID=UPI00143A6C4D|nr:MULTISPECIES: JAB domain-containing protein [Flavobacteriaceae]NJB38102.1 JAB domain-containing protein [Croceivirga sp. JEA036]